MPVNSQPRLQREELGDGAREPGQHIFAFEHFVTPQRRPAARLSKHSDAPVLGIDDPDHSHARSEVLRRFLVELLGRVRRGSNFDAEVSGDVWIDFGYGSLRNPFEAPETHVGAANGVRIFFGLDPRLCCNGPDPVRFEESHEPIADELRNLAVAEAGRGHGDDLSTYQFLARPVWWVRPAGELFGGQQFGGSRRHRSKYLHVSRICLPVLSHICPQSTNANSLLNSNTWANCSHGVTPGVFSSPTAGALT